MKDPVNEKQHLQIRICINLVEEITTSRIQGTKQSIENNVCIYVEVLCV